jgi:hypothetical protein
MGPAAAESRTTPDLLVEAGYKYSLGWPVDEQPIWMRTRSGPLLIVPYPMELNDIGANIHRDHTGREFADSPPIRTPRIGRPYKRNHADRNTITSSAMTVRKSGAVAWPPTSGPTDQLEIDPLVYRRWKFPEGQLSRDALSPLESYR